MARERRRPERLDQPRETRRVLVPTPTYDADAFGRLSERIARFIGTGKFLVYMTIFVIVWVIFNLLLLLLRGNEKEHRQHRHNGDGQRDETIFVGFKPGPQFKNNFCRCILCLHK